MYALLPLPRAQASGLRLGAVGEGCAGGGRGGVRGQGGVRERVGQRSQLETKQGWPQPSLALTLSCPSFPRHLHTFSLLRDPCPSAPTLAPASRPCIHLT